MGVSIWCRLRTTGTDRQVRHALFSINGHLRQEVDFGGNLVFQAGWLWRGNPNGRVLRTGFHYFNGKSNQFEFFDDFQQQVGIGIWQNF